MSKDLVIGVKGRVVGIVVVPWFPRSARARIVVVLCNLQSLSSHRYT